MDLKGTSIVFKFLHHTTKAVTARREPSVTILLESMMLSEIIVVFLNVERCILENVRNIQVAAEINITIPTRMATTRSYHD